MTFTTTMTQKGQVTIPSSIRKALHVARDSKFLVTLNQASGKIVLEPLVDLLSLAGSLTSTRSISEEGLKKAAAVSWGSRWKK